MHITPSLSLLGFGFIAFFAGFAEAVDAAVVEPRSPHFIGDLFSTLNICGSNAEQCADGAIDRISSAGAQMKAHAENAIHTLEDTYHLSQEIVRYRNIVEQTLSIAGKLAHDKHLQIVFTAERLDEVSQRAGDAFMTLLAAQRWTRCSRTSKASP